MSSTYSVAQAQSQLPSLIKKAEDGETVGISRRSETVAFLISRDRMEAIVETLELLANPEAVQAIGEHRAGRTRFKPLSALDSTR
jgi:prevent-host-death family protein